MSDNDAQALAVVTCVRHDDPQKERLSCIKRKDGLLRVNKAAAPQRGLLGVNKTTLRLIFSFLALPTFLKKFQVKREDVFEFAEEIGATFYEVSAKENINVTEMFHDIISAGLERNRPQEKHCYNVLQCIIS